MGKGKGAPPSLKLRRAGRERRTAKAEAGASSIFGPFTPIAEGYDMSEEMADPRRHAQETARTLMFLNPNQRSVWHWMFRWPLPGKPASGYHKFVTYLVAMSATYGVMWFLALATLDTLGDKTEVLKLPFLYNVNMHFMFGVLFPTLLLMALTEGQLVSSGAGAVCEESVLTMSPEVAETLRGDWERIYRKWNLAGQAIGVNLGVLVALINYQSLTVAGFGHWAAPEGEMTLPGYAYLVSIGIFYFLVPFYVARIATTIRFLRALVAKADHVRIIAFHPDGCGGLAPVGKIGLRNQYLLTLAGVNVIFHGSYMLFAEATFLSSVLFAAAIALYLLAGPLCFLGPLFPFRNAMKRTKSEMLREFARKIDRAYQELSKSDRLTKEQQEEMLSLHRLGELAGDLPVWPFDSRTRRKFLTMYILPILGFIGSMAGVLQAIGSLFKTSP